jgi:hypothetical protein
MVGQFDCAQGLENRKQRTTEESHLLPGHNCRRAGSKSSNIFQGFIGGAQRPVLAFEGCGNTLSPAGVITHTRSFVLKPLIEVCGSGVELLNFGIVRQEIIEKTGRMRDLAERQALRLHGQFS